MSIRLQAGISYQDIQFMFFSRKHVCLRHTQHRLDQPVRVEMLNVGFLTLFRLEYDGLRSLDLGGTGQ